MRVLGWKADNGGCGFYRMQQPLDALARLEGWEVTCDVNLTQNQLWEHDLIVIQRVLIPEAFAHVAHAHAQRGVPYIYEIDDLLSHIDLVNPAAAALGSEEYRLVYELGLRGADAVTVSTEPLAEEVRVYNDRVHVLPNCLPDYFAELTRDALVAPRGTPRILWAGSDSHHGDFGDEARYGLSRVLKWSDSTFTSMGYDYRKALGAKGDFVAWAQDIPSFHRRLVGYDIGICPLAKTRFNRSKSGLKAIEYQASGIIPVATDCEAYRPVIEHGETGFLCRTAEDWKQALCTLANDADLRDRMRANCVALTEERLYRNNVWRWRDVYSQFDAVATPLDEGVAATA